MTSRLLSRSGQSELRWSPQTEFKRWYIIVNFIVQEFLIVCLKLSIPGWVAVRMYSGILVYSFFDCYQMNKTWGNPFDTVIILRHSVFTGGSTRAVERLGLTLV